MIYLCVSGFVCASSTAHRISFVLKAITVFRRQTNHMETQRVKSDLTKNKLRIPVERRETKRMESRQHCCTSNRSFRKLQIRKNLRNRIPTLYKSTLKEQ